VAIKILPGEFSEVIFSRCSLGNSTAMRP
jgi:hypothetical protein